MIRTALYNWAYARHTGGKMIFRVEDTDAARDSEESYRQLVDALRWLKIDWDEGVETGGPHAPYRQSERLDIYADVLQKLIDSGAVYESYSTAEEIDARNEANGRAKQLGYDNFDRHLTDEQKAAFRAEGREPAWRLRVADADVTFVDLIRGEVTFPAGSFPDFVVVRAGGQPLYTFTNPVDDALMGITHVIRGEDLMPSTARQLSLYTALIDAGVTSFVPRFGHMPLVLGETGTKKLSKRDPQADLFLHRDRGFIHEGLLNYLALLGWSIGPDRDVFSLEEFTAAFDIADVNPNPARFDQKKAESINGDHIRMLEPADFAARLVPYLAAKGLVTEPPSDEGPGDHHRRGSLGAGAHAASRRGARTPRVPVRRPGRARGGCSRDAAGQRQRGAHRLGGRAGTRTGVRVPDRRCAGGPVVGADRGTGPEAPRRVRPAPRRRQRAPHLAAPLRIDGTARQGRDASPSGGSRRGAQLTSRFGGGRSIG